MTNDIVIKIAKTSSGTLWAWNSISLLCIIIKTLDFVARDWCI